MALAVAPWFTPAEEERNLRRAASRAGCRVVSARVAATSLGPRLIGQVACPGGWGAARMLLAAAAEDAQAPAARDLALELRRGTDGSDATFVRAVFALVTDNVRFVREAGEVFTTPSYTLGAGGGDCDDHARLTYALLRAGGVPARLAFLYRTKAEGPSHVVAQAGVGGEWIWLESTIAAELGEHPVAAGRRLGLIEGRGDITTGGETFMHEKDLPSGFLASAFCALGIEPGPHAVRRFQAARGGLAVDGIYGPKTHAALLEALHGHGLGELAALGMGAIGSATGNAKTQDLAPSFFRGVAAMAERMRAKGAGIDGDDLLAVWNAESQVKSVQNGAGAPYYGLNQMGREQMRGAGFTGDPAAYLALGVEGQLPYVERYYTNATGGRLNLLQDSADLYVANFLPAFLPKVAADPSFVLARRDDPATPGNEDPNGWYRWNKVLDPDGDGTITKADLKRAIARAQQAAGPAGERWLEIRRRYHAEGGAPEPVAGKAGVVLGVLAVMGAAAWWFSRTA